VIGEAPATISSRVFRPIKHERMSTTTRLQWLGVCVEWLMYCEGTSYNRVSSRGPCSLYGIVFVRTKASATFI